MNSHCLGLRLNAACCVSILAQAEMSAVAEIPELDFHKCERCPLEDLGARVFHLLSMQLQQIQLACTIAGSCPSRYTSQL